MGNLFENGKVSVEKRTLEPYGYYLEILGRKHGLAKAFHDWLQIMVCSLSMGRKEELYFKTIKPYDRDELDLFAKAFAALILEMEKKDLYDFFGDYFQENISMGQNGQFFTPNCVSDLMAAITYIDAPLPIDGNKMLDPACGSGRLILASAKYNRNQHFVGQDLSYTCCLMTLINMCLYSLNGEVIHTNTITNSVFAHWVVVVDSKTHIPTIVELEPDRLNTQPTEEDLTPEPVTGLIQPVKKIPPINFVRFKAKS